MIYSTPRRTEIEILLIDYVDVLHVTAFGSAVAPSIVGGNLADERVYRFFLIENGTVRKPARVRFDPRVIRFIVVENRRTRFRVFFADGTCFCRKKIRHRFSLR